MRAHACMPVRERVCACFSFTFVEQDLDGNGTLDFQEVSTHHTRHAFTVGASFVCLSKCVEFFMPFAAN